MTRENDKLTPAALVRTEAAALEALAARLEGPMAAAFDRAVELILRCGEDKGRVVVTGMGKSGIIAQKIAATLSSTGSPALFVGVYYKSWAEMDAGTPGVQRAVESQAYQSLMRVTQDAVAASRWEILRIRPELSCPPDEVVQADPAFWKPKPAPTAVPKPKTETAEMK